MFLFLGLLLLAPVGSKGAVFPSGVVLLEFLDFLRLSRLLAIASRSVPPPDSGFFLAWCYLRVPIFKWKSFKRAVVMRKYAQKENNKRYLL